METAVKTTTSKPASDAHSSKSNGDEANAGNDRRPANEPNKTLTAAQGAQGSLEGTRAPASQVFEPARLAEAQNKDMVAQICQNIETLVKNRQPTLRMVLYPEELGRIDLRFTTSSAGLGVTVMAEQASTNRLLESQMAQLRQSLTDAGIQLAHFSVGQHQNQANSGNTSHHPRGSNAVRSNGIAAVEAKEEVRIPTRSESSELVDYRI